jgi:hypothetical protein
MFNIATKEWRWLMFMDQFRVLFHNIAAILFAQWQYMAEFVKFGPIFAAYEIDMPTFFCIFA